jgi:hypothetical protein
LLCPVALLAAVALARSGEVVEIIQKGNLRVSFRGHIAPRELPRVGAAPVAVSISAEITTTDHTAPPQLRSIKLEVNRNGHLDAKGLPLCRYHQIQPATTAEARDTCGRAIVGRGSFSSNVTLPEQSPFPSQGAIVAFNGRFHGRPAILAHIYGTIPLPTSFTLPFEVQHNRAGTYGTTLTTSLPRVAADWGYVRGVSLTLQRRFRYRGTAHSYVTAGCPAPPGFPGATFALARTAFGFEDGKVLRTTMTRNCNVRG